MEISFSQIKCFRECKMRYYHQYILGEKEPPTDAMTMGILVHEAINKLSELNKNLYSEEIIKMVENLRITPKFAEIKITAWEQKFKQQIRNYTFLGYIDALGVLPNGEEVILEFKTTSSPWNEKKIKANILQPTIYREATGIKNFIYFTIGKQKNPKIQVFKNPEIEGFNEVIKTCDEMRQEFAYPPTAKLNEETKNICFFCNLKNRCELWF